MKIVSTSGEKLHEIMGDRCQPAVSPNSAVYRIPCSRCDEASFGETVRGFGTRVSEHRADVRHHRTSSALEVHVDKAGHLPIWKEAEVFMEDRINRKEKIWK